MFGVGSELRVGPLQWGWERQLASSDLGADEGIVDGERFAGLLAAALNI